MKTIVQKEAKVLREIAKDVPIKKIGTDKINTILTEMREALDSQEDGVAIAAPQIGYPLRIFVVSTKVSELLKKTKKETDSEKPTILKNTVFINPVIKKLSKEKNIMEEGCLSVRYLYGKVKRSNKATVEAYDEHGKKFTLGGTGILAQIFQHEMDHLDGVLFIDKAKYVEEIIPAHIKHNHAEHK
ncbi:MAG: peptide deformylase [bacterium]